MFEYFTYGATVTTANYSNTPRAGVSNHGNMSDHFMINKFVALCRLKHVIQKQYKAKLFGLDDIELLKRGFLRMKDFFDTYAQTNVSCLFFSKPKVHNGTPTA